MIKKNKFLFFTVLLTILMIAIIFFSNGVYPFGKNIFSCGDFDHAYIPVYYKLWDVLHGKSSMLFDWNLGVGLNCFGSLIGNSLLAPTSWIIGLFKRDFVPYAMSYIIIIKMVEVSIITYLSINKMFSKVNDCYKMIFTIAYTFCGWTAFMLSSFLYIDVFALFPLFVFAYYRLLKDNKWLMYLVVLTICLMLNYYMSYLILFFIIGSTVLSLSILDIKDKRKKAVEILLLTLLSLGLSCISFLPSFNLARTSTRMASASEFDASTFYIGETLLKIVYMLPMSLPFYLTFKQLRNKKEKRNNLFIILLLIYLLIGILIPKINAMWHTGSFSGLPFRYAFIPSFILICISLHYLENNKEKKNEKNGIIYFVIALIVNSLIIIFGFIFREKFIHDNFVFEIKYLSQFICILILFVFSIINIWIIFKNKGNYKKVLLSIFIVIYLLLFNLYFIRIDKNDALSLTTQEVKSNMNLSDDGYNYLIDLRNISINAPYILEVPSMQNRIHFINKEMADFSDNLGYEKFDTYIYAHGGNLYTNLLKRNKYIITSSNMSDLLYEKIDSYKYLKLYSSRNTLDALIPYNGGYYSDSKVTMADNTNSIFKTVFNKDEVMHIVEDSTIKLLPGNVYYFETTTKDYNELIDLFDVNDDVSIARNDNETVISIEVKEEKSVHNDVKNYVVSYINIDEFIEFVDSFDTYEINYKTYGNKRIYKYNNVDNYKKVLIPINYDSGYLIKVNGKEVKYRSNVYNMISIDIEKGNNEIEVSYIPKMMKEGIIISLISLGVLVIFYLLNKWIRFLNSNIILNVLFLISFLIGLIFILKIYILFWL